jgi:hypothetical protein
MIYGILLYRSITFLQVSALYPNHGNFDHSDIIENEIVPVSSYAEVLLTATPDFQANLQ